MLALFLLLAAASSRVQLVDEIFEIPASEWRYVELNLKQQPVAVVGDYSAGEGGRVRMALLRREDLERLRGERPHGVLAGTRPGARGALRHAIPGPGEYVVMIDNRAGDKPARVHLRVALDFSSGAGPQVRYLSPGRRLAVILASLTFFLAVSVYSGRRLLRSLRHRDG
jgi:hypothetical protein